MAFVNSLHDYNHRAKTNFTEPTEFKHHNYDALTSFLQDVEKKCSHIMRLYSVGRSVQQRELWVMEVTDHPGQHEPGKTGSDISLSLFLSVCLALSLCLCRSLSLSVSASLSVAVASRQIHKTGQAFWWCNMFSGKKIRTLCTQT